MAEVYLLRHAEKDDLGTLTQRGREAALKLRGIMPPFSVVISSESERVRETAQLVTGTTPEVDPRAGFYMAPAEKSSEINRLAREKGIPFLEAVIQHNDAEVIAGIDAKAAELNNLIKELLKKMVDGESALIVSHDLSISPAMRQHGIPLESIPFLSGYIIDQNDKVKIFNSPPISSTH